MAVAVIMAGGKGERLWPLSRDHKPKQFVSFGEKSFFRTTVDRIKPVVGEENIYVVTQENRVKSVLKDVPSLPKKNIIIEPVAKNTAPAIGLAALKVAIWQGPEETMIVLPADHVVRDEETFKELVHFTFRLAEDNCLITLGIPPFYPHTGYGYIHYGELYKKEGKWEAFRVLEFTEKPSQEVAEKYLREGTYLWNSGMFAWKARVILEEMEKYMPDLYRGLMTIKSKVDTPEEKEVTNRVFQELESTSIDYGVMEKTDRSLVIPADIGWSDVGSWLALEEIFKRNQQGNIVLGKHLGIDTKNCIIWAKKPVVTLGIEDLVVVETDDVIFLMPKTHHQEVRSVIEALKRQKEFRELL